MKKCVSVIFYCLLITIFVLCLLVMSSLIFDNLFIEFMKDIILVLVLLIDSILLMLLY